MPSRTSFHFGASTSPQHSSSSVHQTAHPIVPTKIPAVDYYKSPSNTPRRPSFSMDSLLHPHKDKHGRNDSKDRDGGRKDKRLSIAGMTRSSRSKDRTHHAAQIGPAHPGRFDFIIESPPLVMFGGPSVSTGALLSGRLKLNVEAPAGEVRFTDFKMQLRALITHRKPVQKDCDECRERYDKLHEWTFLSEPKTFFKDRDNQFPFSHLLPGHLPASVSVALGGIAYQLFAVATTATGEKIEATHPLAVLRAIPPGAEKTSIRIFPPTNLTAKIVLTPIIHPIGTFPVQMTLSGVVEKKAEVQSRWRMRKLTWRIEETTKMVSVPCTKHGAKVGQGKGIQHEDLKLVGTEELRGGWKTDFDTAGGEISMEFEAALSTRANHKGVADVSFTGGLEVKHNMVLELIVAEEYCPTRNTSIITPTGAARVLRMQFPLVVTERAGMGVSWDEEMPPVYEDVPESPPGYGSTETPDGALGAFGGAVIEEYHGPEFEYVDLERMESANPNDPPIYRERDPHEVARALELSGPSRRVRRTSSSSDLVEPRPSTERQRQPRFEVDDLSYEPQYSLRRRESGDNEAAAEEDFGEGSAAATQ